MHRARELIAGDVGTATRKAATIQSENNCWP
jgi:hypothetical protein